MPTTVNTVYNSIATTIAQEQALLDAGVSSTPDTALQLQADLSAGSTVSPWRLFVRLFAYASKILQDLWDSWRDEVLDMAKDGHFGTQRWFVAKALAFQFGDALILTPLDGGYAADNPAARIVTHAACVEQANTVILKAAKAAGTGLAKLSPAEALALTAYFRQLRPPVQVIVLTADPDKLRLSGAVIYDADLPLAGIQAAVNLAITNYLSALDFGNKGALRISDLKVKMLAVPGVVDVQLTLVEARSIGVYNTISRIYYSYAGYMVLDAAYPITSSLQWQAGNI